VLVLSSSHVSHYIHGSCIREILFAVTTPLAIVSGVGSLGTSTCLAPTLGYAGARFEVLNLGIPHATSDHILSLFLAEGPLLDPDVVVFYSGANDSALEEKPRSGVEGLWSALTVKAAPGQIRRPPAGLGRPGLR
jgi:hypothetical protein